jgi:hypothetical protein
VGSERRLIGCAETSEAVSTADTEGTRATEGHSFGDHKIHSVSQCYAIDYYRRVILLFCAFMARVRHNLEKKILISDCYVKKKLIKPCKRIFRFTFFEQLL